MNRLVDTDGDRQGTLGFRLPICPGGADLPADGVGVSSARGGTWGVRYHGLEAAGAGPLGRKKLDVDFYGG